MDETEKAQAGVLPDDPGEGAAVMAAEVPRVLTDRDLVQASVLRAMSPKPPNTACTTGHYRLDDITGGLEPECVWVVGADTSWGKSSLAIMIVDENMPEKKFLIVSAEDPARLYGDRLVVRRAKVNAQRFKRHTLSDKEKDKVRAVMSYEQPVYLDARGRPVEWVCRHVKRLIREYGIHAVIYDYLQAFDNERPQQDRRNQVTYIARVLTDSVKTSGAAGIILSQITVQEGKARPDKHSIRESRDVSNAAENVLLGFTPEKEIQKDGKTLAFAGDKCLFCDKVKDGQRGALVVMPWNNEGAYFEACKDPETDRLERVIANETGGDSYDDLADNHDYDRGYA
jgi:replicative DNA helicase